MSYRTEGLKFMWMMVMFDLPTDTPEERREAARFRNFLLDIGFEMSQYSVYIRFVGPRERCVKFTNTLKANNPKTGSVNILFFTDTQFGDIIHLDRERAGAPLRNIPEQLMLF